MRTPARPTRRALLAGAGAAALAGSLTACDVPGPTSEDSSPDADASDPLPSGADPDRQRVESVAAEVEGLLALVLATVAAHPSRTAQLSPLADCHRAHLGVLGVDTADDSAAPDETLGRASPELSPSSTDPNPAVPTNAGRALRRLLTRERSHATALGTGALAAESGALARVLACMGAGVHMHLDALEGDGS